MSAFQQIGASPQLCFSAAGRVLRTNNAARRLRVSTRMVRYLAETGALPGFKRGKKIWFFRAVDVDDYCARRMVNRGTNN